MEIVILFGMKEMGIPHPFHNEFPIYDSLKYIII